MSEDPSIDRNPRVRDWIAGHSLYVKKCLPVLREITRLGARKDFLGACLAKRGLIPARRNQQFFISKLYSDVEGRSYVNGTGRFTLLRRDRRHQNYFWNLPQALRAAEPTLSDPELAEWEASLIAWVQSDAGAPTATAM